MQLSDLKQAYATYVTEHNGNPPKVCKMSPQLFDEFRGFVDPIIDEAERFSISVTPRRYTWKSVEVVSDETQKPFKFRFE